MFSWKRASIYKPKKKAWIKFCLEVLASKFACLFILNFNPAKTVLITSFSLATWWTSWQGKCVYSSSACFQTLILCGPIILCSPQYWVCFFFLSFCACGYFSSCWCLSGCISVWQMMGHEKQRDPPYAVCCASQYRDMVGVKSNPDWWICFDLDLVRETFGAHERRCLSLFFDLVIKMKQFQLRESTCVTSLVGESWDENITL